MADLKLIKTTDIAKVPKKANQLIFVDDGSMYFDYSNTVRLHNSGGAHLEDFYASKEYLKDDMCVYKGFMYRAKQDLIDYTWVPEHWELLVSATGEGVTIPTTGDDVSYDNSVSGIDAVTLQAAIDFALTELFKLQEDAEALKEEVELLKATALTTDSEFELDTF